MSDPWKRREVIGDATLYLGDCRGFSLSIDGANTVITDPPYPNNAGHFINDIDAAVSVLRDVRVEAIVFWSELEKPPCSLPLVAVHVWHRSNVNGRPYEPAYHFSPDGAKRRSDVIQHAAIFDGAGPGCWEYAGHPTQKPVAMMERLVRKTSGTVIDPFMGVGATGIACVRLGRPFVGIEIEPKYFEIACERIENAQRQARMFA